MNSNKKYIVVIEFDYHSEVLLSQLLILQKLPQKIYLFTTAKIWNIISKSAKNKNLNVLLAENHGKVKELILSNLGILNNSETILFNTAASHFKLFSSINYKAPVILRIHNANTYLNATKSINPKLSFFYIWKDSSYLILHGLFKLEMFYREKFIKKRVNYFLFPTHSIKNYVLEQGYLQPEKILPPTPYVFLKNVNEIKVQKKSVNIVIIGGIDKRRRNYNEVLNAFKYIAPKLKTRVTFSLLGKPNGFYGKEIAASFKKLESDLFKVNTFNKYVPQPIFDDLSSNADFLITPTVRETRYKLYKELYGYTKVSGSVNDMVVYKKPSLIPAFYPIDQALKPHFGIYNNEKDLISVLENWIEKREFESHSFKSIIDDYKLENVAKRTGQFLKDIRKRGK